MVEFPAVRSLGDKGVLLFIHSGIAANLHSTQTSIMRTNFDIDWENRKVVQPNCYHPVVWSMVREGRDFYNEEVMLLHTDDGELGYSGKGILPTGHAFMM